MNMDPASANARKQADMPTVTALFRASGGDKSTGGNSTHDNSMQSTRKRKQSGEGGNSSVGPVTSTLTSEAKRARLERRGEDEIVFKGQGGEAGQGVTAPADDRSNSQVSRTAKGFSEF